MKRIVYRKVSFGADPEFFFSNPEGEVVGAEKILPKEGAKQKDFDGSEFGSPIIIIDGVQAEFNVSPDTCRQRFSSNLRRCFLELDAQMKGKGVKADFAQTVTVTEKEMKSLDEKAQQFGCAPSLNVHDAENKISITDASKYMQRSAGGHIHLGGEYPQTTAMFKRKATNIVRMMDILVGNTCVLIDRDKGNIERRKVYGKAGEHRLPSHGIEYRTLSNFWLRSYPLMSLVLALSRFAVLVALDEELEKEILSRVDMHKIQKAINTNDFDLAYYNFNQIKGIIKEVGGVDEYKHELRAIFPLEGSHMEQFEFFVSKGIGHWFTEDPMVHWLNENNLSYGWENFLIASVAPIMPQLTKTEQFVKDTKETVNNLTHAVVNAF